MRVALLQNFVAPYRVPLYERLSDRLTALKVFVSTRMESDRNWDVEWGTVDVEVQRNLSFRYSFPSPSGFKQSVQLHFPYDTVARLWRYRPDAVISVELGPRTLQVVIYKMLRPSTGLVVWCKLSEHTEKSWGGFRHFLRKFILARADAILVNGESGARYIARFGVPDEQIFRINQPIDVGMFTRIKRQRPDSARTRFLCCGMLTPRKGVVPFLQQMNIWATANPGENLEIWWLGDGEMRAELEAFVCEPNLTQRFIGAVPYAQMPEWYAQVDILAFPTLSDEWGLVVNEAMAVGLPILGSIYSQAVTELVEDGVNGWQFDPALGQSVQDAFDRIRATPPEAMATMREAALRRISVVTPSSAATKIFEVLSKVTRPRRKAAYTMAAKLASDVAEPT